jgi:DNA-binding Lrp family transcriptional regulator
MDKDVLDTKDKKILKVMKNNARASIRQISKTTGIRPSTVHQRIKRLVEEEVIEKFTVKLNDEKVGEGFTVYMLISGSTERYLGSEIMQNDQVKGIYGITGEYDLLIKMKFRDMAEFNDFLLTFREKYSSHISKTLTMVQTVKLKDL